MENGVENGMGKMARLVFAAPKSGSGKTMAACGLIEVLKRRSLRVAALKCGPDYIDPMFHRRVLGVPSGNIDAFFTGEETTRYLMKKRMEGADFTVMEGVMGYYDGLGGQSEAASTYEIARVTRTPVVLVVDGKGASVSLAAVIRGIGEYRADSNIKGILLNRVTKAFFPRIREVIERECGIPVVGFLPERKELAVPSRHLGLTAPGEMEDFGGWLDRLAGEMEESVDIDALIAIGSQAPEISGHAPAIPVLPGKVRIGVARDECFSFYYEENLELLGQMGAELVEFSPLHDGKLPEQLDGILLGGGYPENFIRELEHGGNLREEIKELCRKGIPCLAECGGFLYLQQELEDEQGNKSPMSGVLPGRGFPTGRLCRFGYIQIQTCSAGVFGEEGQILKGHEFHYWDSTENGEDCAAVKPVGGRSYSCMVYGADMAAGFPHLYYYSNPNAVYSFLQCCMRYRAGRLAQARWDNIAKPIDGLGLLEAYVVKLCRIAGSSAPPRLMRRALLVLCGDHGVVEEGVTQSGSEVTKIVAENFAKGRSTVNIMAKCAGVDVYAIDAGIDGPYYPEKNLVMGAVVDRKIGKGCGNISREAAMTLEQCVKALETGCELVRDLKEKGYNIIATGEMGIGNTTPSSALAALLLGQDASAVTGRGAGLDEDGLRKKRQAVRLACERVMRKGLEEIGAEGKRQDESESGVEGKRQDESEAGAEGKRQDESESRAEGKRQDESESRGEGRRQDELEAGAEGKRQDELESGAGRRKAEVMRILAEAGGYEIVMMAGVYLGGVQYGMPIVMDGVISAAAALAASKLDCRVPEFIIASHVSGEPAGKMILEALGTEAILHGRMHLGEGTGAMALFPLLDMAAEVYAGMGSFEDYEIEAYERKP